MEFFFRDTNEEPLPFHRGIVRCPFLRNINEPTNFSFSKSMAFPMSVRVVKGPTLEDGPNFDLAFRFFHGQNGVVPLSGRSFIPNEKPQSEPAPAQFNPLAAKAATISLSAFGPGGPCGFNTFSEKWKNQKKKSDSSESAVSSCLKFKV